jgi:hypothetical protein
MSKKKVVINGRVLNSYTASPDGNCEWCMLPSQFLECDACVSLLEVDNLTLAPPTRKAKCGHLSHNYYQCEACGEVTPEDETANLYNFCREVQAFDLRKLGATHANGALQDHRSNPGTRYPVRQRITNNPAAIGLNFNEMLAEEAAKEDSPFYLSEIDALRHSSGSEES